MTPTKLTPIEYQWLLGQVGLNGDTTRRVDAHLVYQPKQSAGIDEAAAIVLDLDVGVLGHLDIDIDVPIRVLREAYLAALAPTIQVGELLTWVPGHGELVRVTETPGPDGAVTIRSRGDEHRVPAKHLTRPQTFAGGYEPKEKS